MPYIPTMPKIRTRTAFGVAAILLPLAAWAQTPPAPGPGPVAPAAATPAEPPTDAEKDIDAAVKQMAALRSVATDVLQTVEMLDQKFEVFGRYLKAPNRRVYLSLKVRGLPDSSNSTLLQVCDGQTLWEYQEVLDSKVCQKLDVAQVLEKLRSGDIDTQVRDYVNSRLGLAGPEELLTGLRRSVKFVQKSEGTLDGKAVWVFRGDWRSREGLVGPNQQPMPALAPLPAYMPSVVTLSIGKDDGWPYKVMLQGRKPTVVIDTRGRGPDGRPIGSKSSIQDVTPTKIALEYKNVKLNPELSIDEFVFQPPPDVRTDDNTQQFVASLDQAIQMRAAQKKVEAAKAGADPSAPSAGAGPALPPAEDSLLKQSIEVPKAGGPAAPPPGTNPPR